MPTCPSCGETHPPDELVRHERTRQLVVHCPGCNRVLGRYRRHGDDPDTDHQDDEG